MLEKSPLSVCITICYSFSKDIFVRANFVAFSCVSIFHDHSRYSSGEAVNLLHLKILTKGTSFKVTFMWLSQNRKVVILVENYGSSLQPSVAALKL